MESLLIDWLGAEKVIWLPGGLEDDETDGHVDNVACFAGPGCVLALVASEADDPNYDILQANLEVLSGRSEEHTSELQSLMRISYAVFCLKKKKKMPHTINNTIEHTHTQKHINNT